MSGTQPTMADAPRSPLSPDPVSDCDKPSYDSEDDQPLKRPESPIKKPKAQYPKGQYPVKLEEDGVLRYRPEEGDFKPQKREDKLTCTFKTKKAKGKPLGKSKSKTKRSLDKAMDEV